MPVRRLRRHARPALLPTAALAVCAAIGVPVAAQVGQPRVPVGPAGLPHVPESVSRPAAWPGGSPPDKHVLSSIRANPGAPLEPVDPAITDAVAAAVASGPQDDGVVPASHAEAGAAAESPYANAQSLDTAMVVARVGPEVVLEADLLTPKALEWLAKVTPGMPPEQVRDLRLQICRQVLPQHVETLLVFVDACREIPEDKLPEIRKNVDKAFDEQFLPKMMQEAGVATSLEYEQQLRAKGQSLDRMRKMFFERGLAQEWMRKNVETDSEVPHADLIAWYQNHLSDYDYPARARFESLTVKIGLKRSRKEAWDMLAAMGNEVLAGRPFAEVARMRSEGPTAAQGGVFDWTRSGSLSSKTLDEAIFSLPVGQLSAIIEDGETLHIVRVVERTEAGRTSFIDAQVRIRSQLLQERHEAATDEYLAKLRQRTPVWTVFDDDGSPADPQFMARRPDGASRPR